MLHISNFDDAACIINGITDTNPAMVNRIRNQALIQSDQEITAHLANAIANASDAADAHAWERSNYGGAAPETLVDHEYYEDLVSAWSMVASEREIETFGALHFADHWVHRQNNRPVPDRGQRVTTLARFACIARRQSGRRTVSLILPMAGVC